MIIGKMKKAIKPKTSPMVLPIAARLISEGFSSILPTLSLNLTELNGSLFDINQTAGRKFNIVFWRLGTTNCSTGQYRRGAICGARGDVQLGILGNGVSSTSPRAARIFPWLICFWRADPNISIKRERLTPLVAGEAR
ncbi:hypothetical protein [Maritalea myrionectae]|uniref:hypothetical protein n=1 Tax=Maritalea myrionectae TaxID=454601 RepID=UPI00146B66E1|nr:hypothetical protein [Maritalea myrionectae]